VPQTWANFWVDEAFIAAPHTRLAEEQSLSLAHGQKPREFGVFLPPSVPQSPVWHGLSIEQPVRAKTLPLHWIFFPACAAWKHRVVDWPDCRLVAPAVGRLHRCLSGSP
jgi:hypothetical protein